MNEELNRGDYLKETGKVDATNLDKGTTWRSYSLAMILEVNSCEVYSVCGCLCSIPCCADDLYQ